jgi:prefoldin alpha subunit
MNQQEYQQLLSEFNYYQELLEQIEQSLLNLKKTRQDLLDFEGEKSKEILAPIANGIYVEAELKNKELLVNVGSDIVVKKSVKEAIEIIDAQEIDVLSDQDKIVQKVNYYYNLLHNQGE